MCSRSIKIFNFLETHGIPSPTPYRSNHPKSKMPVKNIQNLEEFATIVCHRSYHLLVRFRTAEKFGIYLDPRK